MGGCENEERMGPDETGEDGDESVEVSIATAIEPVVDDPIVRPLMVTVNAAVMPMMKGMVCPPQHNPSMEFSVLEFDRPKFESLPNFLQEMITGSTEYQAMMKAPVQPTNLQKEEMLHQQEVAAKLASDDAFDDLPF